MRSQGFPKVFVLTTAALAALMLSACGPGQPQTQSTTAPGTSVSPSTEASPSESPQPSPSSTGTATPAGPKPCKAATLSAATDATGGGAAGSVYMKLNLTNKGTAPCLLKAYPGVSLVAKADGAPIGAPATRDETNPVTDVLLAPGQTGSAVLRYTQAGNYPDCTRTNAAGYRIYPPGDTASLFLPQPTTACSNTNITLLSVGAFQPA